MVISILLIFTQRIGKPRNAQSTFLFDMLKTKNLALGPREDTLSKTIEQMNEKFRLRFEPPLCTLS